MGETVRGGWGGSRGATPSCPHSRSGLSRTYTDMGRGRCARADSGSRGTTGVGAFAEEAQRLGGKVFPAPFCPGRQGKARELRVAYTPAGLTPSPPVDVIHTVGPIAYGEPSASQAAELRSCYLSSLDLLLEHRLRSAVRGGPRGRAGGGAQ